VGGDSFAGMGCEDMGDRDVIVAAFGTLDAALDDVADLDTEGLTTPELLELLALCERVRQALPAVEHRLSASCDAQLHDSFDDRKTDQPDTAG
jgi:hypothetical protein